MKTTVINARLKLSEYKSGICFGTDALLLASFVRGTRNKRCVDLGTGSGVIPLLLLETGKCGFATGIEIQEKYAVLSLENARANGYGERYEAVCGDVRDIRRLCSAGEADFVTANPPYLKANCGFSNSSQEKGAAFHELNGTIGDFAAAAAFFLKTGGAFYTVYRPERTAGLLNALSAAGLEPKILRPVAPESEKPPSLILVKSVKGAAEGLIYEKNLVLYADSEHRKYTDELMRIYDEFS